MFEEEATKMQFIKSKNKYNLSTKDIGFSENNKIYLSHDLTKMNLELYKTAVNYKKEMEYKYLWINNGNILLRKSENSKVMLVQSLDQLN